MKSILIFLLTLLVLTNTTILVSAKNATLKCRRCLIDARVGSIGGVALAPPEKPESEKKPNVGAVVGFTFLLVFILVCFCVCVYQLRRTGSSRGSTRQHKVVVQPSVPKNENPPQGRVEVKVEHRQQGQRGGEVVKDDKKVDEGLKGRLKERNQRVEEVKGQNGRGKERNQGPEAVEGGKVRGQNGKGKVKNHQADLPEDKNAGGNGRPGKGKEKNHLADLPEGEINDGRKEKGKEKNKQPKPLGDEQDEGKKERRRKRNEGEGEKVGGQDDRGNDGNKGKQLPQVDKDEPRKKRDREGREAKQPNPPDEDVGRQHKRGKEEIEKEVHNENFGGQNGKQPRKEEEVEDKRRNVRNGKQPQQAGIEHQNSLGLPNKYTLGYLQSVTNYFDPKNKIGGGGFGIVYKGTLSDGTMIAAKCLIYRGGIDDFKNEIEALGRADHSNLVKLMGYCTEGMTKILVYEYMSNGSLDKWIFRPNSSKHLAWPEMKNIIKGIAKGLVYLHEKCEKTILHRDLKPPNVILDEKKNAKLCDFGLAKLLNKDQSSTSTNWAGTRGYMAPEVKKDMRITDKVDVYSFGIVVLEVLFGKRYQDLVTSDQHNKTKEVKLNDLIQNLSEDMKRNGKEIEEIGKLAKRCISESPDERPSMKVTLAALRAIEAQFKEPKAGRN